MMICKETYSDIVQVWPFKAGEILYATPFNVRRRIVPISELGVLNLKSLLEGRPSYSVGESYSDANCVEMEERKCVLKSATKFSSVGRTFEVSLSLIINEKSTLSANMMDEIESESHDFIVMCVDGDYLLVRSLEMSYRCTAEEEIAENYQQKLTIKLENYNGIQRIEN